jgi:hypothetical protein
VILNPASVAAVSQQAQLIIEQIHAAPRQLFAAADIALEKTLQRQLQRQIRTNM